MRVPRFYVPQPFAVGQEVTLPDTTFRHAIQVLRLGVGEPLIYGVTLPRGKPFITACLGASCGGFFIGLMAWLGHSIGLNTVFGPSGVVSIPLMVSRAC